MRRNIGEILIEQGYATESEIQDALEIQRAEGNRRKIGEILAEQSVDEAAIMNCLSLQLDIPVMSEEQIPDVIPMDRVSFEFLKANGILPLSLADGIFTAAVSDPSNTEAIDSLKASFECEVSLFLAPAALIQDQLERLHASKDALMQRLLEGVDEEPATGTMGEISHLKDLAQEKGIIQLVNILIENAVKESSSDIHVEPEETGVRVRYRIDGILYDKEMLPLKTQAALSSRIKLLSNMNIAERRLPQDGRIKGRFNGKEVDIRVSTIPTVYGESIVMRILDKETAFLSLEELGFDSSFLEIYEELIKRPYGMILITGPTGSGKTTTLYASLERINSPEKKIITVEEPVEYLLKGVNQIQVRPKIGLTFASGLRHIVRQDPDVIMVGEVRDLETAGIAIHAALTGHLLFSTLHTNDSPSAVTRLIDMGVENFLVASTLIGVVAQRLVRKICPHCKEEYSVTEDIAREIGEEVKTIWRGRGCDHCMHTGYRGRVAIFELFVIDDRVRDLIVTKASVRDVKNMARSMGMRTLREDGLEKVRNGVTTIDEVFRVTQAEVQG